MRSRINMVVVCDRTDVLAKIEQNRDGHAEIVKEARAGFIDKAKKVLAEKLGLLKEGKLTSLIIDLAPPQDYTSEYNTVIQMLSMHTEKTITLSAEEVRMFIEDKWDWTEHFLTSNSYYSPIAASRSSS